MVFHHIYMLNTFKKIMPMRGNWLIAVFGFLFLIIGFCGYQVSQAQAVGKLSVPSTSLCSITRDLKFGMIGPDVKELQKYLNNNGFPLAQTGVGSKGKETAFFGSLTKTALAKLQKAKIQTLTDSTKLKTEVGNLFVETRNVINGNQQSGADSALNPATPTPTSTTTPTLSYILTYFADYGGKITGTSKQTIKSGGNGTSVTATPNSGYYFTDWSDDSTTNPRTDTNVTANKSVTASFAYRNFYDGRGGSSPSVATYTLTYTAGAGGTISGTASQTVNSGNSGSAVTAVPNTGYSFVSWSDAVSTASRTDSSVTANKSVTASFAIDTYTVTFDANGSTGGTVPADQTKTYDVTLVLATNSGTLVKTGYTFSGWNTLANGTGTDYAESANYIANAGVTLFAKWTIVTAPSALSYTSPNLFIVNTAISTLSPTVTGSVDSYSVSPALPAGLSLDTTSGQITGTPTASTTSTTYTVTATNGGGSTTFDIVIMVNGTITIDSQVWMDRNVGATQAAIAFDDYLAYGSLFQWGRAPDGHQLINWTSSSAGTAENGTTITNADVPGHHDFITEGSSPYDWRVIQDATLWASSASTNNPCPTGWHVPTETEWSVVAGSGKAITNSATAYSTLKLTVAGYRGNSSGSFNNVGSKGNYWASTVDDIYSRRLNFNSSTAGMLSDGRAVGFPVRCLKD